MSFPQIVTVRLKSASPKNHRRKHGRQPSSHSLKGHVALREAAQIQCRGCATAFRRASERKSVHLAIYVAGHVFHHNRDGIRVLVQPRVELLVCGLMESALRQLFIVAKQVNKFERTKW